MKNFLPSIIFERQWLEINQQQLLMLFGTTLSLSANVDRKSFVTIYIYMRYQAFECTAWIATSYNVLTQCDYFNKKYVYMYKRKQEKNRYKSTLLIWEKLRY